jgi:hypothetical protein
MALLDDLGTYLSGDVGSLTLGTNLFLGRMPDTPDTCVAIYEYGGEVPVATMNAGAVPLVEQPRVQVVTRASGYATARTLATTIWASMEVLVNYDSLTSGLRYHRVGALQSPFALERDTADRILVAQNFRVIKAT